MNAIPLIEATTCALAIAISIPMTLLALECLQGSRRARTDDRHDTDESTSPPGRPTVDVLIPAHNEEQVLHRTIIAIQSQLTHQDRLCVVADNCSDSTADIARSHGAIVVERFDDRFRAKGYAIDAGLNALADDSRDVTIMIDADCIAGPNAIGRLASEAMTSGRPSQAQYRMSTAGKRGWNAVSSFAVTVKNHVRPLGLARLGYGCALTGSGIAFPSPLARHPNWASDNIVEDMKISYDLTIAGLAPQYVPNAIVTAVLPETRDDAMQQRKRWEHGHLQTIATVAPRLVVESLRQRRLDLMVAAIDLTVPPLALLAQIVTVTTVVIGAMTWGLQLSGLALATMLVACVGVVVAMLTTWFVHGREQLPAAQLCTIPFYIVSKIPLYVTAVLRRQRAWIRTPRTAEEATICT